LLPTFIYPKGTTVNKTKQNEKLVDYIWNSNSVATFVPQLSPSKPIEFVRAMADIMQTAGSKSSDVSPAIQQKVSDYNSLLQKLDTERQQCILNAKSGQSKTKLWNTMRAEELQQIASAVKGSIDGVNQNISDATNAMLQMKFEISRQQVFMNLYIMLKYFSVRSRNYSLKKTMTLIQI
jgi:hypothetical protein